MSNPYYNHGTTPATNSSGSSALVRAEFDSITTGFGLLPPLTPGGFVVGNAGGSALAMSSNISESGTTVTAANALTVSGVFLAKGGGLLSGGNWGVYASGAAITASFPLDVVGTVNVRDNRNLGTTAGAKLFGGDAGNNPWVGSNAGLPFELRTNGAVGVTLSTTGQVGIGTVPSFDLDLLRNTSSPTVAVRAAVGFASILELTGNGNSTGTTSFSLSQDSANKANLFNRANAAMTFATNNVEHARLTAAGELLVGSTASLQSNPGRGVIEINGTSDSIIEFKKADVGQGFVYFDASGNGFFTASLAAGLNFSTSGTTRFAINATGSVLDGANNTFVPINRAVKTAATARSSTTALTDDPHLVVPLSVGTWSYRVWLPVWCTTANTGQFKVAVAYSSTSTTNSMGVTGSTGANSGFTYNLVPGATGAGAIVPGVGAAPVDFVLLEGVLVATGAGNISVQWAQTVSNGNAVNVGIGGYITCTKIA